MLLSGLPNKIYLVIVLSCLLLAGVAIIGRGSSPWILIHENHVTDGLPIDALNFTDAKHGWALTAFELQETTDGGKSWVTRLSSNPPKKAFYGMTFTSPETVFVVGAKRWGVGKSPLILFSRNGGNDWREARINGLILNQEDKRVLFDIKFCGQQTGWAAGSGLILKTGDGGLTWDAQYHGGEDEMFSSTACADPQMAWVVETSGTILRTVDGGRSWDRQSPHGAKRLLRVRYFNNKVWVVGDEGTLLCSKDNGVTWEKVELNTTEPIFDVHLSERTGWLVGANGTILSSTEGSRWQTEEAPTNADLTSVFVLNSNQVWVGGGNMVLLHRSN